MGLRGISLFRTRACLAAVLLVAGLHAASAQTSTAPAAAPATTEAKPGDDRWFYIEDCMKKT